jgi:hypothetical protein
LEFQFIAAFKFFFVGFEATTRTHVGQKNAQHEKHGQYHVQDELVEEGDGQTAGTFHKGGQKI